MELQKRHSTANFWSSNTFGLFCCSHCNILSKIICLFLCLPIASLFYSIDQLRYGHLDANKKLSICSFTFTPSATVTLHLYEHILEGGLQTLLLTIFLLNNKNCHPITRPYTMPYIEVPTTLASLTLSTGSLMFDVIELMMFFIWYCNDTKFVLQNNEIDV